MSTRGLIAIQDADKKVRSVYLHFDSYVDGAGEILVNHYTTKEQVEELLDLGPMSGIEETIEKCVAYHRDRSEKYQDPVVWDNADTMLKNASDMFWAEYCYLFKDGEWYFDKTYEPKGWRLVKDELKRLEMEGCDED